jgi:hypothetical protein
MCWCIDILMCWCIWVVWYVCLLTQQVFSGYIYYTVLLVWSYIYYTVLSAAYHIIMTYYWKYNKYSLLNAGRSLNRLRTAHYKHKHTIRQNINTIFTLCDLVPETSYFLCQENYVRNTSGMHACNIIFAISKMYISFQIQKFGIVMGECPGCKNWVCGMQ